MAWYNNPSTLRPPLSSLSECMGYTRGSEDSSELVFLLVENYNMTASHGFRIVWEFLNHEAISSTTEEKNPFFHHRVSLAGCRWRRNHDII